MTLRLRLHATKPKKVTLQLSRSLRRLLGTLRYDDYGLRLRLNTILPMHDHNHVTVHVFFFLKTFSIHLFLVREKRNMQVVSNSCSDLHFYVLEPLNVVTTFLSKTLSLYLNKLSCLYAEFGLTADREQK